MEVKEKYVRKKVPLAPGFSMIDWAKVSKENPIKVKPKKITKEELATHCTKEDAWLCIHGRVYDVTNYFPYHPGGVQELMRGVGKDATELWNTTHPWLNIDAFMGNNIVGYLI